MRAGGLIEFNAIFHSVPGNCLAGNQAEAVLRVARQVSAEFGVRRTPRPFRGIKHLAVRTSANHL